MIDHEAFLTAPALAAEGKPAIYEDADGVRTPLRMLFAEPFVEVSIYGQVIDDTLTQAMGPKSALRDACVDHFLEISGRRWTIKKVQPDGRAWTKLMLGGPIGEGAV